MNNFYQAILSDSVYPSEFAEPDKEACIAIVVNAVDAAAFSSAVMLKKMIEVSSYGTKQAYLIDIRDPFPVKIFDKYYFVGLHAEYCFKNYYNQAISQKTAAEILSRTEILTVFQTVDLIQSFKCGDGGFGYALTGYLATSQTEENQQNKEAIHCFLRLAMAWREGSADWNDLVRFNFASDHSLKFSKDQARLKGVKLHHDIELNHKHGIVIGLNTMTHAVIQRLRMTGWDYTNRSSGFYGEVHTSTTDYPAHSGIVLSFNH